MEPEDPSKMPAVARWSRPGFLSRVFGGAKAESFMISHAPDSNIPIALNVGNAKLKWENGIWHNLNFKIQPPKETLSQKEIRDLERENAQLQVQCEILLHMLTVSEMSKIQAQNTLNDLKAQISERISALESGTDDESC